jgi:diacylglycerol kinase
MAYSGNKGFTRIIKATGYSWQGLRAAYRHEAAFRQEIWLCIVIVPLGLYLGDNGVGTSSTNSRVGPRIWLPPRWLSPSY